MMTAPVGDYQGVPLNPAGVGLAKKWNLAADIASNSQCKAWGAGGIMRQPTRLRVSWADDNTLKFETDSGTQTRLFKFGKSGQPIGARSLQGDSVAVWMRPPPERALNQLNQQVGLPGVPAVATNAAPSAPAADNNSLKVVTGNLTAGYLRKNGIPYSENAIVTEYFDRVTFFGVDYLNVVTIVTDPTYLTAPFTVSGSFKREPNGSKWNPGPCNTRPPGNSSSSSSSAGQG
jgi:hypothetical protein